MDLTPISIHWGMGGDMKVIIAGPRDFWPHKDDVLGAVVDSGFPILEVVTGMASGVDTCGLTYAKTQGYKWKEFPAKWNDTTHPNAVVRINKKTGKPFDVTAGFRRNQEMADYADALIAIRNRPTNGTSDMIERMEKLGKPVYVKNIG